MCSGREPDFLVFRAGAVLAVPADGACFRGHARGTRTIELFHGLLLDIAIHSMRALTEAASFKSDENRSKQPAKMSQRWERQPSRRSSQTKFSKKFLIG